MVVHLVMASLCEGEIILIIVSVPMKGRLKKLHNEEPHCSCCSLNIIRIIKGDQMGGGKHKQNKNAKNNKEVTLESQAQMRG